MMNGKQTLLQIDKLTKSYKTNRVTNHRAQVVKQTSLEIYKGECLALIGESGSGKSTLGKCLLRLLDSDEGSVWYQGINLLKLSAKQFRPYRSQFQMVFQNSLQALNPRQRVGSALTEPLRVHFNFSKETALNRALELLQIVRLEKKLCNRFPNELSGGQRQRVALARALAIEPTFLVADEPTSSLDAYLKRNIIHLLQDVQKRFGLTLLLISHDLSLVYEISDRIAVMYAGEIIEIAPVERLLHAPGHPYSKVLIHSCLHVLTTESVLELAPKPTKADFAEEIGNGCQYSPNCPYAEAKCFEEKPVLKKVSDEHAAACHLVGQVVPFSRVM